MQKKKKIVIANQPQKTKLKNQPTANQLHTNK